jgi:hypothetical protein
LWDHDERTQRHRTSALGAEDESPPPMRLRSGQNFQRWVRLEKESESPGDGIGFLFWRPVAPCPRREPGGRNKCSPGRKPGIRVIWNRSPVGTAQVRRCRRLQLVRDHMTSLPIAITSRGDHPLSLSSRVESLP